jgi:hypothetical protein
MAEAMATTTDGDKNGDMDTEGPESRGSDGNSFCSADEECDDTTADGNNGMGQVQSHRHSSKQGPSAPSGQWQPQQRAAPARSQEEQDAQGAAQYWQLLGEACSGMQCSARHACGPCACLSPLQRHMRASALSACCLLAGRAVLPDAAVIACLCDAALHFLMPALCSSRPLTWMHARP